MLPFSLSKRLHRDRRRIALCSVLMLGAGLSEAWNMPTNLPFGVFEAGVGIASLLAGAALCAVVSLTLPRKIRELCLPVALTLFIAALMGRIMPHSSFSLFNVVSGSFGAGVGLVLIGYIVHRLLYGPFARSLLHKRKSRQIARATSSLTVDQLWYGMVPTPGRREAMHDSEVLSVDWEDRDRQRVRVIRWAPPSPKREEHLKIQEVDPGNFIQYSYVRESGQKLEMGNRAIKIIDNGTEREVLTTEFRHNRPLHQLLFDWLDDTEGRHLDRDIAHLEAAIQRAKMPQANDNLAVGGPLRARHARPKPSLTRAKKPAAQHRPVMAHERG